MQIETGSPETMEISDGVLLQVHPEAMGPQGDTLAIPDTVRCLSPGCFARVRPQDLLLPVTHPYLVSVRGVLYSRDRRLLVAYPPGRRQSSFRVPQGVREIGPGAFAYNPYLQDVYMTDNISGIGPGAFYTCRALRTVRLSARLTQLPADPQYGVFARCASLETVELPAKLARIGAGAFEDTSVRSIQFPTKLSHIEERALRDLYMDTVTLPPRLQQLGAESLGSIGEVFVTGCPTGLIHAFVSLYPLEKRRHTIHVLAPSGFTRCTLHFPDSLSDAGRQALAQAWDAQELLKGLSEDLKSLLIQETEDEDDKLWLSFLYAS